MTATWSVGDTGSSAGWLGWMRDSAEGCGRQLQVLCSISLVAAIGSVPIGAQGAAAPSAGDDSIALSASGYRMVFGVTEDGFSRMSLPQFRVYGADGGLRAALDGIPGDWSELVVEATLASGASLDVEDWADLMPHLSFRSSSRQENDLGGGDRPPPKVRWVLFGASWSEPCAELTVMAEELRTRLQQERPGLEIDLLQVEADMLQLTDAESLDLFGALVSGPSTELSGSVAPPFRVERWLNSEPLSWPDLEGKVVLLDFWATWCRPCLSAFGPLEQLQRRFGAHGFQVVTVHHPSRRGAAEAFLRQRGIALPTGLDAGEMTVAYGADAVPIYVLVGRDGRILEVWNAVPSEHQLEGVVLNTGR